MARTKEQNEKMRTEKKELILKEALKQFSQKGLFATKIKDIAEGVGMAQGLLYIYYKSKEEIYTELVNRALDKINEAVDTLDAMEVAPHEKIRLSILEMIKTIENNEEFNQICRFIAQATNSSAIPLETLETINLKRDRPYHVISKIMKEGQKQGTITEGDPYELAVLFWTSINGLAIYKATREGNPSIPQANLIINLFLNPKFQIVKED